jgi:predicted nuclease with RNAse H fold
MTWAGVDVGGLRKGFHVAVVDDERLVAGPLRLPDAAAAVEWLAERAPALVAVDSPCAVAPAGFRSRPDERVLAAAVCGIRYTPEAGAVAYNPHYEWIRNGLDLYGALAAAGLAAVECFPTASWTRWAGARMSASRARWSASALAGAHLAGVPPRLNQDERDAVAAALTARCHSRGETESFGPIVVPL